MRSATLALVSVCVLGACNPSAPPGGAGGLFPDLTSGSYRAEATVTNEDGSTMPIVLIRDRQKQRMEFNSAQGQSVFIVDGATGEAFSISSVGGQTMAMRMSAQGEQFTDPTREWSADLASTATRTGSCSVAGQSGAEWTRTNEGVANVVCVTDDGIILRASEGERVVWETTSVQRGPQDASLFTLPPGVQVVDLSDLGPAMEAMERAKTAAGQ
jgi:hypothetical protein